MKGWETLAYGGAIALCASAFKWPEVLYDKDGKFRTGAALVQIPTAMAIGAFSFGAIEVAQRWLPTLDTYAVGALAGAISFIGPIAFMRAFDALLARFSGGRTILAFSA